MKILFCVEFYLPSIGGAQEVVRQLAERMSTYGHEVSVATSRVKSRKSSVVRGVCIQEFPVSGNRVRGLVGDVESYQKFLATGDFDVVLFYAAQQWTFDAAWPVMASISGKKVLVPCGYSGLFEPAYREYFAELPSILRQVDHVVYHASNYRDYDFGAFHSIDHFVVIPNGADDKEFLTAKDRDFRRRHGISNDAFLILTVGSLTGLKGHLELAKAFNQASFPDKNIVLILNGNTPTVSGVATDDWALFLSLASEYGWKYAAKHSVKKALWSLGFNVGKGASLAKLVKRINATERGNKRVLLYDLPRHELVQAYLNADLFVFASNIEYSPLVLFEACAAGLPFLSAPVGNAAEICTWTNGGEICPADVDERGYTRVDPDLLARRIEVIAFDEERRIELGRCGRSAWEKRYNWKMLAREYEDLFVKLVDGQSVVDVSRSEDTTRLGSKIGINS